jgi:hypothetical protein
MSYCSTLTDNQVRNVLCDEASRFQRHGAGDVAEGAKELYYEAREECARRGIDADEELRERGIRRV